MQRLLTRSVRIAILVAWTIGCRGGLFAGAAELADPAPAISFVNDVLPVLSKLGCNQGACHGSAAGKGGFRLSLRGFAPELDHPAMVREFSGRRVNLQEPEASLLIAKPTLAVPHQGGRLLASHSKAHRILVDWLRQGAPAPRADDPQPIALDVSAPTGVIEPGQRMSLRVEVRFSDGGQRDVTEWARFDSNESSVATVDEQGVVHAAAPGKAALSAAYQSLVGAVEVTVPYPVPTEIQAADQRDYASLVRSNYIDELVIEQWRQLRLWPSRPGNDATFLRRVHLDLTGTLPQPDDVQPFLADADPHKRQAVIDRLLESPEFVDCWSQRWGDVFRVSREWLGEKSVWTFHRYLRHSVAHNVPWDQVVRELVAGAGNSSLSGPPNFYRLQKVFNEGPLWPLTAAETTAQTFLGIRTQCARCHNHPLDRWTQDDYYGMAGFFAQVASKTTVDGHVVIFDHESGEIPHPRRGSALPPKALDGPELPAVLPPGTTRREFLADWMTAPDNPYFARATANRVWRYLMGRGLVEPVDDLRASNPATNEALLNALAADLVEHGFDLQHLIRAIAQSATYQLSSEPTSQNRSDTRFGSYYLPRRLSAEQLLDALGQVTGQVEKFPGLPPGVRSQQLPDSKIESKFLDMFGRPLRRIASCECERVQDPNLGQALELMNSAALHERVTADNSLVNQLLQAGAADATLIEQIYLRSLGRLPTGAEVEAITAEWAAVQDARAGAGPSLRREFFEDLLWAVLNSKEFLFNH